MATYSYVGFLLVKKPSLVTSRGQVNASGALPAFFFNLSEWADFWECLFLRIYCFSTQLTSLPSKSGRVKGEIAN